MNSDTLKCSGCSRREGHTVMKPREAFANNCKARSRGGKAHNCRACDNARRHPQRARPEACPFNIPPFWSIYEVWPLPQPGAQQ